MLRTLAPLAIPSFLIAIAAVLGACAGPFAPGPYGGAGYGGGSYLDRGSQLGPVPGGFADIGYATWQDTEPEYRLYPGDQLDVTVLSAPELSRSVAVQPDGRITMPLVPPLMVADRPIPQVEQMLAGYYSTQLIRPQVAVTLKEATPIRVFVTGEVERPGIYDMPGDIDALQAIIMAGGFKPTAKSTEVVILRRGPGGGPMMRTANLRAANIRASAQRTGQLDIVPLRRFDVVFVPRKAIAEVALFMQQYIRDPLPFQFSYVVGGQFVNTR